MQKPIILLTFANSQDEHLPQLQKEMTNIEALLSPLHDKELIEVHVKENATLEAIYSAMVRFNNRVAVFHFAGHANSEKLKFEDFSANMKGLAKILESDEEDNLQLVFLNGCSTKAQVQYLLDLGVHSVIATSAKIADTMASNFANKFYEALGIGKKTIQQAFEQAIGYIEARADFANQFSYKLTTHRGEIALADAEADIPLWGLYLNENLATSTQDWRFPQYKTRAAAQNPGASDGQYTPNEYIPDILAIMRQYNPSLEKKMFDDEDEPIDRSEYPRLIINNFPLPIGYQIQKLVSTESKDEMNIISLIRLKQIVSTYTISMQIICFLLLSELWEKGRKLPVLIQNGSLGLRFFDNANMDIIQFNFLEQVKALVQLLAKEKDFFIEEWVENQIDTPFFESITQKNSQLENCCADLEKLKKELGITTPASSTLTQLCEKAEQNLVFFLKKIAFLCKYKMLTIRDIEMYRPRFQEGQYQHRYASLNLSASSITLNARRAIAKKSADSGSIILVKKIKAINDYLNLSPFIIDRNVFIDKINPQIFLMVGRNEAGYLYLRANKGIYDTILEKDDQFHTVINFQDNSKYVTILKEQLAMFKTDLNLEI